MEHGGKGDAGQIGPEVTFRSWREVSSALISDSNHKSIMHIITNVKLLVIVDLPLHLMSRVIFDPSNLKEDSVR